MDFLRILHIVMTLNWRINRSLLDVSRIMSLTCGHSVVSGPTSIIQDSEMQELIYHQHVPST